MSILFMMLILLSSFMFFFMTHPLSMGFMLMFQTLLISLFSGLTSTSFWFSYSLFLIFMGGMLILFMYMTSLASNELFMLKINMKFLNLIILTFFFIIMIMILSDLKNFFFNLIKNHENLPLNEYQNLNSNSNFLILNKLFNFPVNMISILLVNYLFLTLIMSVKITKIFMGPLRSLK